MAERICGACASGICGECANINPSSTKVCDHGCFVNKQGSVEAPPTQDYWNRVDASIHLAVMNLPKAIEQMTRLLEEKETPEALEAVNYLRDMAGMEPLKPKQKDLPLGGGAPKKDAPKQEAGLVVVPAGALTMDDNAQWTNRFKIKSESSDRMYTIAQNKKGRFWGCDCPGWIGHGGQQCKHLRALGIPGSRVPFEATLKLGPGVKKEDAKAPKQAPVFTAPPQGGGGGVGTGLAIVRVPSSSDILPDNSLWKNRFQIKSESSDRLYVVSQNKNKGYWGCSCPGWIGHRKCKHLTALGLPPYEKPFEATLKQGSKNAAEMLHSDNDLGQKLEGHTPSPTPEAGPSNTELHENSHVDNGQSPVIDGEMKHPERQNVNAIREALETQVEMEVGKPIAQKQEEVAMKEQVQDAALAQGVEPGVKGNPLSGATEVTAKPGTQIIINVASKKIAYVSHVPGHRNSKGEAAPWVIKQHNTDKILESFKSEGAAKEGLKNMESHKGSVEKEGAARVRITGGGVDNGKEGIVIPWNDPRAAEESKNYPFVGGRTPTGMDWIAILLDNGQVTSMPKNYVQQIKRSYEAEGIGGEDQGKITSGHGGGMFGGTDLEGPSFHVGFTLKGKQREVKFSSITEAQTFIQQASQKFGKMAGDWTMKCPWCGGTASKDKPQDDYKCGCGWDGTKSSKQATDENSVEAMEAGPGMVATPDPFAVNPAERQLVLELLKAKAQQGKGMTTGEVEKALGGGKYSMNGSRVLNQLAQEGLVKHKQMRWYLKQAANPPLAQPFVQCFILDEYGDTEEAANLDSPAQAMQFFAARGIGAHEIKSIDKGDKTVYVYKREGEGVVAAMRTATIHLKLSGMPQKGTPEWHQLQIAIKTLKMPKPMQGVMGQTEEAALQTLSRFGLAWDDAAYMAGGSGVKHASKTASRYRLYTGPTMVQSTAKELSQAGLNVTIEGTEHVIFESDDPDGQSVTLQVRDILGPQWGVRNVQKLAGEGMAKTEQDIEKEAGFNFFFPGQVLKEFYPEIQHEIVDYPNASNSPMGLEAPEMVGNGGHELEGLLDSALDTTVVEMIQLPGDVGELEDEFSMAAADYSSTSPAGGMGIGRDGKSQVLEGVPLRKENDIRGPMFTDEFYGQYSEVPGAAMAVASKRAAAGDEAKQFSMFLKKVCGEIAATMVAAFKVTSRPLLDQVPGVGEVQLDQVEQSPVSTSFTTTITGSRVKYLMDKLNDSEVKSAINEAWAQGAVWHDGPTGGYVYEVFVRPETIDTESLKMVYKFVAGTRE